MMPTVMDDWPRPPIRYRAQRGTQARYILARLLRAMHRDNPAMARLFFRRWKAAIEAGKVWGQA